LLTQGAAAGPVPESIADNLAAGGILAGIDCLADECDHFGREGDADLFDGRHGWLRGGKNSYWA